MFQCEHPEIGGIGFMKYLNHAMAPGPSKHRGKLGEGEPILVVKSHDPGTVIRLRSLSLFDPNGLYIEFNVVLPPADTP